MNECDPNQTTQFEISRTGLKISSKRMSEFLAAFALAVLASTSVLLWQLVKAVDGVAVAVQAATNENRVIASKLESASRNLACVILTPETDPQRAERCKTLSGVQP